MVGEEVLIGFVLFSAPASEHGCKQRGAVSCGLLCGAIVAGTLTLAGFAQMTQPPPRPAGPVLSPEANRLPDANDQMLMRERNAQMRNYAAANAERRKQLMQASEMLETMAMALKAEVDKSDDLSENTIHK